jgi:hypothetical protein
VSTLEVRGQSKSTDFGGGEIRGRHGLKGLLLCTCRGRSFVEIRGFYFGLEPLLTEAMDDTRQILTEHLPQLALYFALNKFLDYSN